MCICVQPGRAAPVEDRGAWKQQKQFSVKNKKYSNLGFK